MGFLRRYLTPRVVSDYLNVVDKIEAANLEAERRLTDVRIKVVDKLLDEAPVTATFNHGDTKLSKDQTDITASLNHASDMLHTKVMENLLAIDEGVVHLANVHGKAYNNAMLQASTRATRLNKAQENSMAGFYHTSNILYSQLLDQVLAIDEAMANSRYVSRTNVENARLNFLAGSPSPLESKPDIHNAQDGVANTVAAPVNAQNASTVTETLTLSRPSGNSAYLTLWLVLAFFLGIAFHQLYRTFLHSRIATILEDVTGKISHAAKVIYSKILRAYKVIGNKISATVESTTGTISRLTKCRAGWAERRTDVRCTLLCTSDLAISVIALSLARVVSSEPSGCFVADVMHGSGKNCPTAVMYLLFMAGTLALLCLGELASCVFKMIFGEDESTPCLDGQADASIKTAHKCGKCA